MNEHDDERELPILTNDDVRFLHDICMRASESQDPPVKALFDAQTSILKEEGLEDRNDEPIYSWLMRIGEGTKESARKRQPVDLEETLNALLQTQNISIVQVNGNESVKDDTLPSSGQRRAVDRRASYEDARLEETWLSEHSQPVNPPSPPPAPHSLLRLPPRRAMNGRLERRTRSTSSQRSAHRPAAPKRLQTSSSQDYLSDDEKLGNPTLLFEPSQTQLEMNADAFYSTSEIRLQRRVLHVLHDRAVSIRTSRVHDHHTASALYGRRLLKACTLAWRATLFDLREQRRHEEQQRRQREEQQRRLEEEQRERHAALDKHEERAVLHRNRMLLRKAFTHWANHSSDERLKTRVAQRHILRGKYFRRWKAFTVDNLSKSRRILCTKYVALWREKTSMRLLAEAQAVARYEESLMKRSLTVLSQRWYDWLAESCFRRRAMKNTAQALFDTFEARREMHYHAEAVQSSIVVRHALQCLRTQLHARRLATSQAERHHDRTVTLKVVKTIEVQARLAPLSQTFKATQTTGLQRKALQIWQHQVRLVQQAESVDRHRTLQNAWTAWNDNLRCRALGQRIDERLVVEYLYRWVLQARLKLFQRTSNERLVIRLFAVWRGRVHDERSKLEYAEDVFNEGQRRRRLRNGLVKINLALRQREDGERAAIEFWNVRAMPQVLEVWKEKHDHYQKLEKWARMANFYRLTTRFLGVWRERTTEHKARRRRDAYIKVRARVKIYIVGTCLRRWRAKAMEVTSMNGEAERRTQARSVSTASYALTQWRQRTDRMANLDIQATSIYQRRLARSGLGALLAAQAENAALQQQALDFKRETEVALLASALRRLLWESFTAARRHESAEALRLRNRDTHIKQMLRYWAARVAAKRMPANPGEDAFDQDQRRDDHEPESPSLRPASRAASRASASTTPAGLPPFSPPQRTGNVESTPGYMRTPSRARRTGRFRPLPTPAAITPMAFSSASLATNPAPTPFADPSTAQGLEGAAMEALTPQVTPFDRKLRAGGFGGTAAMPPSALRTSVFGRNAPGTAGGTSKSVRFTGSGGRFGRASHLKGS